MSRQGASGRMPFPAIVALVLAATVDLFRQIPVPGTTGLGALTVAAGVVTLFECSRLLSPSLDKRPGIPLPMWLFLGWAFATAAVHRAFTSEGVQNLCVYSLFVGGAALTARFGTEQSAMTFYRRMCRIGVVVAVVYLATWAVQGQQPSLIFGARGFAFTALILLAVTIPLPKTADARWVQWAPYLLLLAIGVSLSRTAGFAALVILLGRVARGRAGGKAVRAVLAAAALTAGAYWLVQHNATLNDRVFGGDRAYAVGSVNINTEGRTVIWAYTREQIASNPWLGHGAGAASRWVAAQLNGADNQPHCDYLRLIDDFGWVGLVLWSVGYLMLLVGALRRARQAADAAGRYPHVAALLALLAVAIAMATDNVIIYPFVMAPLGVLVGFSIALGGVQRRGELGVVGRQRGGQRAGVADVRRTAGAR